jgi:hypothetical protein
VISRLRPALSSHGESGKVGKLCGHSAKTLCWATVMAMGEVLGLVGRFVERIFTMLPSLLIAWKYPPQVVAKSFFIVLPKPDALHLYLAGTQSHFRLALTALNLSPIWVEVERLDMRIAVANQPLYEDQVFYEKRVEGFSAFPEIIYGHRGLGTALLYFNQQLESARADAAAKYAAAQPQRTYNVQLRIEVHGRCKTGRIERTDISFDFPPGAVGLGPD